MWVRFNTTFDTLGALRLSWPLVVGPLLVLFLFARKGVPLPRVNGPVPAKMFRRQLGNKWFRACGICAVGVGLLSVALPLAQIVSVERTWTELPGAVAAGRLAIWDSLAFAVGSASLVIGLSLAGSPTPGSRGLWFRVSAIGWLLWVPFLFPGVLLGIGLIHLFNHLWSAVLYQGPGIVLWLLWSVIWRWDGARSCMRSGQQTRTSGVRHFSRVPAVGKCAAGSLAPNRGAGCGSVVCGVFVVPLGCGINDSRCATRR